MSKSATFSPEHEERANAVQRYVSKIEPQNAILTEGMAKKNRLVQSEIQKNIKNQLLRSPRTNSYQYSKKPQRDDFPYPEAPEYPDLLVVEPPQRQDYELKKIEISQRYTQRAQELSSDYKKQDIKSRGAVMRT